MASHTTARLTLFPLRLDDADEMFVVLNDTMLHEFTGGAPLSLDELRVRYARLAVGRSSDGKQTWLNFIARLRSTGEAIGTVQATLDAGEASIAWIVGSRWQGHGYATEAAAWLVAHLAESHDVQAIVANVHPMHLGSQRVAQHVGLTRTDELVGGENVWRTDRTGSHSDEVVTKRS